MAKINFNKPTMIVINDYIDVLNLNFSHIIGGSVLFPSYTYIGINTPFVVNDPSQSDINGATPFANPNYQDNHQDTQFILATHSPSIIGHIENEKFCIDLTPNTK